MKVILPSNQFQIYGEISSDEENDAKLWRDMVVSMRQWQQRKLQKEKNIKNGHLRYCMIQC